MVRKISPGLDRRRRLVQRGAQRLQQGVAFLQQRQRRAPRRARGQAEHSAANWMRRSISGPIAISCRIPASAARCSAALSRTATISEPVISTARTIGSCTTHQPRRMGRLFLLGQGGGAGVVGNGNRPAFAGGAAQVLQVADQVPRHLCGEGRSIGPPAHQMDIVFEIDPQLRARLAQGDDILQRADRRGGGGFGDGLWGEPGRCNSRSGRGGAATPCGFAPSPLTLSPSGGEELPSAGRAACRWAADRRHRQGG